MSWSVDAYGHVFPDQREAGDDEFSHVIVDRDGVEWSVRELTRHRASLEEVFLNLVGAER